MKFTSDRAWLAWTVIFLILVGYPVLYAVAVIEDWSYVVRACWLLFLVARRDVDFCVVREDLRLLVTLEWDRRPRAIWAASLAVGEALATLAGHPRVGGWIGIASVGAYLFGDWIDRNGRKLWRNLLASAGLTEASAAAFRRDCEASA